MVAGFVLDVSATLAWCFENEATPESRALLAMLSTRTPVVPDLWHLELTNALVQAERLKRLTQQETSEFLDVLQDLLFETDTESGRRAYGPVLALARRYGLTTHEATYLDLAMRRGLPLATRDRELSVAATKARVELIDT
jgi:predicted nucleic acid-binding protein